MIDFFWQMRPLRTVLMICYDDETFVLPTVEGAYAFHS